MKLETITAFALLLKGAGKAATDQILKDLMKQLRNGLVDKALVMRVASAQVSGKRGFIWLIVTNVCLSIRSVYKLSYNTLHKPLHNTT